MQTRMRPWVRRRAAPAVLLELQGMLVQDSFFLGNSSVLARHSCSWQQAG